MYLKVNKSFFSRNINSDELFEEVKQLDQVIRNALYNNHKQIVITSDRPPKNIAHLKDRLRSRFEGGLIVNIKPPDLGTRTRILHEKAERDGIYIPEEIINYIAGKIKSNVRTLIGILNRVVAHSSLTDRDLDTKLVDEVLTDILDERAELPVD